VELTGQLSNLSALLEKLLSTPLVRASARAQAPGERRGPVFHQRRYELVRDALLAELAADGGELRLKEILRRVEQRLGELSGWVTACTGYGLSRALVNARKRSTL
jgi:hypothetical protein